MGVINTEIMDPASLTEFMRTLYVAKEEKDGVLSAFLPNFDIDGATIDVTVEGNRPIEPAKYRAFDAEPRFGADAPMVQRTIRLLPLSEQGKFGELDAINGGPSSSIEAKTRWAQRRASRIVNSYFEALEAIRARLLLTGNLTITQEDLKIDESFGRSAEHNVTAATLWNAGGDILDDIAMWVETYKKNNFGAEPGTIVASGRIVRQIAKNGDFATQMVNGGSRAAGIEDINDILLGQGLPTLTIFDRANAAGRLIPDDRLLLLPAPGEKFSTEASELGGTPWGTTATSQTPSWGISDADAPGLVAALFDNDKPPVGLEVVADAIALPVLANANRSLVAKVF